MEGSILKRKINILLLAIPLLIFRDQLIERFHSQLLQLFGDDIGVERGVGIIIFFLAALTLIPLAGFVESAVEELAELLGPFVGGLLHTTFGNVAELTIALFILLTVTKGGPAIVEGSIAGVIIRNSLLFLGMSTLAGCWRNGKMSFNAENASEYTTVFALAIVGLSIPTIATIVEHRDGFQFRVLAQYPLSAVLAIVLLISYLAYIGFAVFRLGEGSNLVAQRAQRRADRLRQQQERRQRRASQPGVSGRWRQGRMPRIVQPDTQALFPEERSSARRRQAGLPIIAEQPATPLATEVSSALDEARADLGAAVATAVATAVAPVSPAIAEDLQQRERIYARAGKLAQRRRRREERGESVILEGRPILRGIVAALVLAIATAGVASMSEALAGSIESIKSTSAFLQDKEFFLGLIVIPVLAGVVEFYGSVESARENHMEITMAVTAGATIQMILLVTPLLVLAGLLTGHPLDLIFSPLNIIMFGAATFVFMLVSRDGESSVLEGVQLVTLWTLIGIVAFFLPPA